MTAMEYKKYTTQAKVAIKGEAFFETLISDYSIPHHVMGPKDVGIDYFCEWVYGDKPTGVLYAVQIKTLSKINVSLQHIGGYKGFNKLESFKISNPHLQIDEKTLQYWQGLGIPVYLFAIIYSESSGDGVQFDCYYKRFTPVLTTAKTQEEEPFYQVNSSATFLAYADMASKSYGFARDLFIDLMRCSYFKGSISYISPRTLGLEQFPDSDAVFGDLFEEYRDNIFNTYDQTREFLERILNGRAIPSAEAEEN